MFVHVLITNSLQFDVLERSKTVSDVLCFGCFSLCFSQVNRLHSKAGDPFYEAQENHNLIGVANVFLECLFHDVKLQYAVPIISQQGEVS